MKTETNGLAPDPARLAAARSIAHKYFDRKRMWTKVLFVVAALSEVCFFGAMLFFFDFSDRFYWFLFLSVSFVYCPLILFIFRNSFVIDRLYYRLLLELKYSGEGIEKSANSEQEPIEDDGEDDRGILFSFLEKKNRWVKVLFVVAAFCETILFLGMLYFMDFSSQLNWFLLFGFMGVYSPLIISTWRNTFAIDRVYYGLIDELKYSRPKSVE